MSRVTKICQDCDEKNYAKGFCLSHYRKQYKWTNEICVVEDCLNTVFVLKAKMCQKHYIRNRRHGDPSIRLRAEDGTGYIASDGYKVIEINGVRYQEHRYIMSQYLGRKLHPFETVHHKNGQRSDNRLDNLELWASKQPPGQRVCDLLSWAHELIDIYEGPGV